MAIIRSHFLTFSDGELTLRPMTDEDLPLLCKWNADPEVLHFSEGDVDPYSEEETESLYGALSQKAHCFMISADERVIGECRISPMASPFSEPLKSSTDCRRIDIVLGEKDARGKKYGSRAIGFLCRFAFENTSCTHVFACDIFDYNVAAVKAFENNGFKTYRATPAPSDDEPGVITMFKAKLNKIF